MKDYMEMAQNFIDSNRTVPDDILQRMNIRERQLISKMIKIKSMLTEEMDCLLADKSLHLQNNPSAPIKRRYIPNFKLLYAAAALLLVILYFPVSNSIKTKILLKEETANFVNQLFVEDEETYILADLGITSDWFNSGIISDF